MAIKITATVYVITSLCAVQQGNYETFLKENLASLNQSKDHWALFGVLNFHWNFLTYDLLEHLIYELYQTHHLLAKRRASSNSCTQETTLTEVKKQMDLYKRDIMKFKINTTLKSFCEAVDEKMYIDDLPPRFVTAVSQHSANRPHIHLHMTLADVDFHRHFLPQYNFVNYAMMLNSYIALYTGDYDGPSTPTVRPLYNYRLM